MSQARVETVKKCRKAQKPCEKCGQELPVGSAYRYFYVGFRSTWKRVRCMKPSCTPTRGERESSLLGEVYDAQDNAESTIQNANSWEEIQEALTEVKDACENVASQYEEASTDVNGNVFNQDAADRQETLEQAASDIEDIDKSDLTKDCDTCDGKGEIDGEVCTEDECDNGQVPDIDSMRDDAISELMEVELP